MLNSHYDIDNCPGILFFTAKKNLKNRKRWNNKNVIGPAKMVEKGKMSFPSGHAALSFAAARVQKNIAISSYFPKSADFFH